MCQIYDGNILSWPSGFRNLGMGRRINEVSNCRVALHWFLLWISRIKDQYSPSTRPCPKQLFHMVHIVPDSRCWMTFTFLTGRYTLEHQNLQVVIREGWILSWPLDLAQGCDLRPTDEVHAFPSLCLARLILGITGTSGPWRFWIKRRFVRLEAYIARPRVYRHTVWHPTIPPCGPWINRFPRHSLTLFQVHEWYTMGETWQQE